MFADNVLEHSNAGVALGDVTASFDNVAVLNPRGRFEVEMYLNFLKLVGQVGLSTKNVVICYSQT